jgi:hypothetical protein
MIRQRANLPRPTDLPDGQRVWSFPHRRRFTEGRGRAKLRAAKIFLHERFQRTLPARSWAGEDLSSVFPKGMIVRAHPVSTKGRFAIVTDAGGGLRWTQSARKTSVDDADDEAVWS